MLGVLVLILSLMDNGNNNFLRSIAKSNYYPYGVDSSRGATGKFSNGDTFVDYLGGWLGLPAPPPFADPTTTGQNMLLQLPASSTKAANSMHRLNRIDAPVYGTAAEYILNHNNLDMKNWIALSLDFSAKECALLLILFSPYFSGSN
ncbi:hypothetical protein SASPL_100082 [Salvia splendens]|uniref:Uncharacterized protein n=1 Tax=Salvia splendens TaxID=180675 RepID=A0A8X9A9Z0_SALSN|nr:hypothetical protein SASPL_100082 [Salvia splendens]